MNVKTRVSTVQIMWLAVLFVASGNAFASSAWWMMCDWCVTGSDFSNRALNAPGTYETVYVTNRDANETRKYNRTFIIDDLWDGVQQSVFVGAADFPAAEQAVFTQAVENATILEVRIPRDGLVGPIPGVGEQGSVVGDISSGFIRDSFINALRNEIINRNFLPTHTQINTEAGLTTPIIGVSAGAGNTIRVEDLVIVIDYDDGSAISVTRRASDGKFVNWSVTDAEGNEIDVQIPDENGNVPINPGSFVDREFIFDGPGSGIAGGVLAELLDTDAIQCVSGTSSITGRVFVRCSRR